MSILCEYLVSSFQGRVSLTRAHRELRVHEPGKTLGLLSLKLPEFVHDPLILCFGPGIMLGLVGELPEMSVDQLDLWLERGLRVGVVRCRKIFVRNNHPQPGVNGRDVERRALVPPRAMGAMRRRCSEGKSPKPGK